MRRTELDLTPSAIDKTNDPVRMYLQGNGYRSAPHARGRSRDRQADRTREVGGHQVDLAHADRSREPSVRLGEQLRSGERTIRELVIFQDEELTDDRIADRGAPGAHVRSMRWTTKLDREPEQGSQTGTSILKRDKKRYRRYRWRALRARVELSQLIRCIEFTEPVKRPPDRPHQGCRRERPVRAARHSR